jgi:lipopolysaccharide assembly outer membrane protein LptD (OstA)
MKNKSFKIFLIILFLIQNQSLAETLLFSFETKTLEISNNGNLINATDGKAVSLDKNFEIYANNFEYLKKSKILNIDGNGKIFIRTNNLIIEFDQAILNEKNLIFEAFGNIKIKDVKNIQITSQKILFDLKNNILTSPSKSIIRDNYLNNLVSKSIKYEIDKEIIKN